MATNTTVSGEEAGKRYSSRPCAEKRTSSMPSDTRGIGQRHQGTAAASQDGETSHQGSKGLENASRCLGIPVKAQSQTATQQKNSYPTPKSCLLCQKQSSC